jgi:acetolactate synthase-1/2/3 large subunit
VNGAQSLLATAERAGLSVCFANPGTTEMPLVEALDGGPGVRPVLGLFEGVVTGAADGYARMAGRPALTLLHLGPGFANGIANLHNARRAGSPVVNLIGDMATWHRHADAPLTTDIASLARPVSHWLRECRSAGDVPGDLADAVAEAGSDGGRIATLVVPSDCQQDESGPAAAPRAARPRAAVADETVQLVADALRSAGGSAVVLLGADGLSERGLRAAGRVAAATGSRLLSGKFPARIERGGGLPAPERLGYFPEQAAKSLEGADTLVLAGEPSPMTFFGYPGTPSSEVAPGTRVVRLAGATEDVAGALEELADRLGAPAHAPAAGAGLPDLPSGRLTPRLAGTVLAALQPEDAIVVDESLTCSAPYYAAAAGSPRHTVLCLTGGAIGQGLPSAVGAAVACPDRPVLAYQADGSGLYTAQALWTMARERLDVTVLVCANRTYRILQAELDRAGVQDPGPASQRFTSLADPAVDWVQLAGGYGVPARRAETAEEMAAALRDALAEPGPHLVELGLE